MLIRSMIGNIIEQQLHAAGVNVGKQRVEIRESAENRIDVRIVADIVTEVGHRRRKDRRDPDRVHAEPFEIVELALNAAEITDAVAVAVFEGARINLINNPALPPAKIFALFRLFVHAIQNSPTGDYKPFLAFRQSCRDAEIKL